MFSLTSHTALANGGTVQVSNAQAGPYLVSIFTSPNPIRVGAVDVSVLVQHPGSTDVVEDVIVVIAAEPVNQTGKGTTFNATHEQATNKLYYAANVVLSTEGRWRLDTIITGPAGDGELSFEVEATRGGLGDSPLFLLSLIALPVLAVLAWLVVRSKSAATPHGGG